MIERTGDMFTTDAKYLLHGANCVGVMGSGIAKTVKEKFPYNFTEYAHFCTDGYAKPGSLLVVPEKNGKVLVNLFTQDNPGPSARYEWVFSSAMAFSELASEDRRLEKYGRVAAIPEIGCGIGGLEWRHVRRILKTVERIHPAIEYEVWHYQ